MWDGNLRNESLCDENSHDGNLHDGNSRDENLRDGNLHNRNGAMRARVTIRLACTEGKYEILERAGTSVSVSSRHGVHGSAHHRNLWVDVPCNYCWSTSQTSSLSTYSPFSASKMLGTSTHASWPVARSTHNHAVNARTVPHARGTALRAPPRGICYCTCAPRTHDEVARMGRRVTCCWRCPKAARATIAPPDVDIDVGFDVDDSLFVTACYFCHHYASGP